MSAATCAQPPKMGSSSQLPEGGLPFGYNLSDETFLSPPLPHGDPILGPNDNSLLGTFFTGMESNEYNMFSYGEGLNFSDEWIGQIAPNLLGHSTSFGPQPPPDMASAAITGFAPSNYEDGFTFEQNMMPPPPPPPPQQQQQHIPPPLACPPQPAALQQPRPQSQPTLRDMYQGVPQSLHDQRSFCLSMEPQAHAGVAALLELQSGHPNTYSRTGSLNGFHPSPNMQPPRNQRGSHSQPISVQSHNDPVRPSRSNQTDTLFTDMMFGSQESTVQRPAEPVALQWGSDTHFARNQAFVPAQHETSEALENKRLATIREALKFTSSTPNTRASSPVGNIEQVPYATPESGSGSGSGNVQIEEDAAIPPKKRRKSKAKTEVDDGGDYAVQLPPKATARKRKSKSDLNGAPESSLTTQEAPGKRRKSAPSQPKPPRENLTDAQKRENHIKSEQKRRGAIKEGFDDLTFIVPNLQNGGYSKSSMLNMAGDWLESLIKENQMMESK